MNSDTNASGGPPESARCISGSEAAACWEHFSHGADIGVRGRGPSKESAFTQAAVALTAVVTQPERVRPLEPVAIHCEAPDLELLLADFLNALVYEMAARQMLFSRFELVLDGGRLSGTAWGESVDVPRHRPVVEVKGATYTDLRVVREDGQWLAQCIVDV